jgi:hypothetical protein
LASLIVQCCEIPHLKQPLQSCYGSFSFDSTQSARTHAQFVRAVYFPTVLSPFISGKTPFPPLFFSSTLYITAHTHTYQHNSNPCIKTHVLDTHIWSACCLNTQGACFLGCDRGFLLGRILGLGGVRKEEKEVDEGQLAWMS